MAVSFTATNNAFEKGIENVKPNAAVKIIEGWEAELEKVDAPGVKGIVKDLEALKKALSADEPDGEKVKSLVAKLGEATTKIAAKADEKTQSKVQELGEALTNA